MKLNYYLIFGIPIFFLFATYAIIEFVELDFYGRFWILLIYVAGINGAFIYLSRLTSSRSTTE